MIKGAMFWNDRNRYYRQDNNPTEILLRSKDDSDWLESCGPTAAVNCLAAMGKPVEIVCPGTYKPQPEETLMDFFNDPRNKAALDGVRANITFPRNRVPQFYPLAVYEVFGVKAKFVWGLSLEQVAIYVCEGNPVQICLKKPGHYIAVVAFDLNEKLLIYNDSWPGRFEDKNGFNKTMDAKEFSSNVQNYFIVYGI